MAVAVSGSKSCTCTALVSGCCSVYVNVYILFRSPSCSALQPLNGMAPEDRGPPPQTRLIQSLTLPSPCGAGPVCCSGDVQEKAGPIAIASNVSITILYQFEIRRATRTATVAGELLLLLR